MKMRMSTSNESDDPDHTFHSIVRRQNRCFGFTLLTLLASLVGVLYFSSADLYVYVYQLFTCKVLTLIQSISSV